MIKSQISERSLWFDSNNWKLWIVYKIVLASLIIVVVGCNQDMI